MKECPSCHRCFQDQVNHCPSDGERLKFLITLDTLLDERYLLERKLGQGGMGLVFKAQHKFIRTLHAIKVILPDLVGNDPSLVARFRAEAMAAAAIRHPNTVSVTDYGILGGTTPYLVMEFVEGISLHDLLTREKRIAPAEAVEIMLAVCAGVAAAHREGIVHRDLKPLNIMLRPGEPPAECVKVLDFGLAKIKSGELLGSLVAAQTQGMMGSPFYMAPEQWHDEDIDVRADIYSLGVILYQMLTGDVPFKGKSIPSIMNMHLNTPPVPLSERGIDVPEPLERAVRHALEKDPARRPQSATEFMAELRAALPKLNGSATTHEVGVTTMSGGPVDTMGFSERAGVETGLHVESPEGLITNVGTPNALDTGQQEAESVQPGMKTVAGPSNATGGGDIAAPSSDTARQQPAQTAGQSGGVPVQVSGEALTEPLPAYFEKLRSEEERQRAEALRRQEEEEQRRRDEEQRREAEERARRDAEERARLEAAERARRETEERERREAEERQRREGEEAARRDAEDRARREAEERARSEAEERARREAEERSRREEAERAAALAAQQQAEQAARQQAEESARQQQAALAAQQQQAAIAAQQQQSGAGYAQYPAQSGGAVAPSPSRLVPILIGSFVALVLLAGVVGVAAYLLRDSDIVKRLFNTGGGNTNSNVSANTNNASNANAGLNANTGTNANGAANVNSNTNPKQTGADLVQLPGGTFRMGRDDVPPMAEPLMTQRPQYLLWMYNQWPAHNVTVKPFAIDRTEVTNAEYAEFVKETGQQPPANWDGNRPKAGEEQMPVTDVSYDDAVAFATWRSRRDGVLYRLPTEDEWEYAARGGGDPTRLYPWGSKWEDGRANLGTDSLRPVGSFPQGNTPQGVADMIGNVWEWTTSKASMYEGNNKTKIDPKDLGKIVVRGGSFAKQLDGDHPVTVTSRQWFPHDLHDPRVGFRLVRAGT
jgi:serine/threonine-protein kinase